METINILNELAKDVCVQFLTVMKSCEPIIKQDPDHVVEFDKGYVFGHSYQFVCLYRMFKLLDGNEAIDEEFRVFIKDNLPNLKELYDDILYREKEALALNKQEFLN